MSGDIEADGMVVEPIVQLARALTAVPNGAELHGCCRGEVALWPDEAPRLRPVIPQAALDRLKAQGRGAAPRWAMCPLLDPDTKRCSVYEQRPLMCRAYLALTPADHCYPEQGGLRDVLTPIEPIVAAAEAMRTQPSTTLREMLWAMVE